MSTRIASILLAVASSAALASAAQATVLLQDGFDAENGGVGAAEYSGFANFSAANIDLLAPGYFYGLCQAGGGNSTCLDMEGSGNGSLTSKAVFDLAAATVVTLRFDLAGDQRGQGNNAVTASLTSILGQTLFSEVFNLPANASFTTFTRNVTIPNAVQARLGFLSSGPADSYGLLLDNVVLSAGAAPPVPEPSTAALMVAGLGGAAALGARRQRRTIALGAR